MEKKLNLYRKSINLQNNLLLIIKNSNEIENIAYNQNKDIFDLAKAIKKAAMNLYEQ